ncbi:unnamed protein product [Hymenolepis diminuta]|uniref:Maspardin n=1 Tax=Hymenolepis diminuta TaxID=6216 RepID=A0A564Z028_HYMDI|nr:unnamed protein product [Hymenolepis diminuta]
MDSPNMFDYETFIKSSNKTTIKIDKYTIDMYDTGPREISCPIVCLPPTTCDASIFYKVQTFLSNEKFRIISMNYPETYTTNAFCEVFLKLLDELHLVAVHIVGASLGGFLAQKFCEFCAASSGRVKSLILCNTYTDTYCFETRYSAKMFWLLPLPMLRMTFEYPCVSDNADNEIKEASKSARDQCNKMSQGELASRLTMACRTNIVATEELQKADITIIEVGDIETSYKNQYSSVHRAYPEAKVASLDTGGHFPFLSRYDEFATYMKI